MVTMEHVMDYLIDHRSSSVRSSSLSDIIERLLWCLDGPSETAIFKVQSKWLGGDDVRRVEVALFMEESFPYDNRDEMVKEFSRITSKWPHLQARCEEVLQEWDRMHPQQ